MILKPGLGSLKVIEMIPFDRPHMTSYRRSIVTMALSGVVSEINGDFRRKLQIFPPVVFCVPAEGVPLAIGYRRWGVKKLE